MTPSADAELKAALDESVLAANVSADQNTFIYILRSHIFQQFSSNSIEVDPPFYCILLNFVSVTEERIEISRPNASLSFAKVTFKLSVSAGYMNCIF